MSAQTAAPYIEQIDYAAYGISDASFTQVNAATSTINAYLQRPEGLIWSPCANGMPGWMAALNPTATYKIESGIAAGSNVQVSVPNATFGSQSIGDVVILDRNNSGLSEASIVAGASGNTLTLASVQFDHSANVNVDFGLTIMEERPLPANRPITRVSRGPIARVISGVGRYGLGRRGQQVAGIEFVPNLLPVVQGFGGPPLWVPFDVTAIDLNPYTGEIWVPSGLLLAYYSDVRLRYVAGWSKDNLPSDIKQACANIVRANIDTPFSGNMKVIKAGDSMLQRFGPESLDDQTKRLLDPYKSRLFA